jgi:putative CocE/NonD family hydrolase
MIPMRDGVKLHVVILRPAGSEKSGEPLPFLMERTPYGVDGETSNGVNASKPELARVDTSSCMAIFAGGMKSEGQFVMNRPIVAHDEDGCGRDDGHAGHDRLAAEECAEQLGQGGRAGSQYPGFLAMMAGIDAHPAVKAISPQAPMTDVWLGDDFFHNGAFRETYGFDYVQELEAQKTDGRCRREGRSVRLLSEACELCGCGGVGEDGDLPTAKVFLNAAEYTKFWQDMAVERHLTKVEVPTLEVGGWWDQEDMWGTQAEYAALKPHDKNGNEVFMVLGPWNHGGWGDGRETLGDVNNGEPTGQEYRSTIEAPFFEKYLKGKSGI